jgi:hypothetical protein
MIARGMLLAACLAACLAVAGSAAAQQDRKIAGHARMIGGWHGVGLQVGRNGVQSTWDIDLRVRADITSRIEYPSLGCAGTLHELRRLGDEIEFREEITSGDCIDGGRMVVRLMNDRVWWFWYQPGGGDADASAVLYRDAPVA